MRVAVITLSCFGGLALFYHTVIPLRLLALVSSGERSHEGIGSLALFALWVGATALIYGYPGIAWWLFALLGIAGLYDGLSKSIEQFAFWGAIALGLAAITWVARGEKRAADQRDWARGQHELAVHVALRSLHETVPELFARLADAEGRTPHLNGAEEVRPGAARRS